MSSHFNINEAIKAGTMGLIASLPRNDVELARAAERGGADMLKVHLNVRHAASGTYFGSLDEEKERIESIIDAVDIPVGIMPGSEVTATLDEMRRLEDMGVSFYDIYAKDMPAEYLDLDKMAPMAALSESWKHWESNHIAAMGINMLEASIVPHTEYGNPLVLSDLLAYSYLVDQFSGIVIVPTQKAIKPAEVRLLDRAGVRGLMIGRIVTGDTPESFEKTTAAFAAAIEDVF